MFGKIDWASVFAFDEPILETFVRGSVVYLALFLMLRFIMRRQTGGIGVTDLLVIVLIADASQNAMASDYSSIADGILLVAVIIFWDFVINWMAFHMPWFGDFIDPKPVALIKHGKVLHKHLKQELITPDELMSQLRLQGVDDVKQVKSACMESDGKVSVVTYGRTRTKAAQHKKREQMT